MLQSQKKSTWHLPACFPDLRLPRPMACPACAAALAVLNVIQEERLQENAVRVGGYAMERLRMLQEAHPDLIADVRGEGLMVGIEIVTDRSSLTQAPAVSARWGGDVRECSQHACFPR
jgi:4-aminobutyrate aminotransferase-like enzyme